MASSNLPRLIWPLYTIAIFVSQVYGQIPAEMPYSLITKMKLHMKSYTVIDVWDEWK